MFRHHLIRNTFITLILGITAMFTACSSDSSPSDTTYNGPGSRYVTTFRSDGTFTLIQYPDASSTTADITVDGTYTTLSTGFKKLTVTSATGTGAPSAGDEAYGIEVPGYVFVLKPLGSGDQIIPMVTSGACPSADMTANWAVVNLDSGATVASADLGGTFNYDYATSTASVPAKFDVSGGSLGSNTIGTGSCSDGIMTIGNVDMYLTDSGGAIVNTDTSDPNNATYIFAFAQTAIGTKSSLDGTYAGLVFNDSGASGSKISPVKLVCSSGTCTGNAYTDVETGALDSGTVTLTLGTPDTLGDGLILATIDMTGGTTGNVICTIDKNAGTSTDIIGSCTGQDPGDTSKMFNVLFTKI